MLIAKIIETIHTSYPHTQAIYLYGTWGTEHQRPDSDLDIAILLPYTSTIDNTEWLHLSTTLASIAKTERIDLIDLRTASTILRKEIIAAEKRIYCANEYAADEFKMLTLSFYQKLNDERRAIVESGIQGGRFYDV